MLLAIDTATRWTGIALHDGAQLRAELGWHAINTQTVELAPTLSDLLRKVSVDPAEIRAVAVAIGPGSYTGLRVGLGFAKGIALAHNAQLIGINTLDIVAEAAGQMSSHLVAVCEAGRGRVCAATYFYYSRKAWQLKQEADIYQWEALIAHVPAGSVFVGEISADARTLIRSANRNLKLASPAQGTRRAAHLAELAIQRLHKGDVDDPAALVPVYLRDPTGKRISETP
jgi:tRNA threonylcarbamoyladenosine biosynthesis protein TsaB